VVVQVRARELSILLLLKPALPIRTYTERYGHAVQSLVEVDIFAAVFCSSGARHRAACPLLVDPIPRRGIYSFVSIRRIPWIFSTS